MRRRPFVGLAAFAALAALTWAAAGRAGDDKKGDGKKGDEKKSEEGFKKLFNDKDLTGWVYSGPKGEKMDGKAETPDKRIVVREGKKEEGKGTYKDGAIVVNSKDATGKGGI